jgi:hypothetical protein
MRDAKATIFIFLMAMLSPKQIAWRSCIIYYTNDESGLIIQPALLI